MLAGSVAGLAYLVPKPDADQLYALIKGVIACDTAIALPIGLKATPVAELGGSVAGFAYLAPNPVPLDQAYALT